MKTLIKNATVVPMQGDGQRYFTGSVAVDGNRIVLVADDSRPDSCRRMEEFRAANPDAREIDGRGKLLMPGLINTHTHVAMTLMRNLADDLPLMKWLNEKVWPFEAQLGAQDIATGARLGIAEMLLGGTTTFVDMYWHEAAVAQVARDMGVRAVLSPSFVDGERMAAFERDLAETLEVAAGCDRLSVRVAPHAAYSCSEENLRRAVELAHENGIGLTIHLSETIDEQQIIRERHGLTPTEYLHNIGFFESSDKNPPSAFRLPTIAAHGVYVTESDMEILRTHGVAVAHNPQSNMKLASGAAPVARMVERGMNVTLGTDGASSNNDLDMWDEMRTASLLGKLTAGDPTVLPAYEILRMATVGGARALGMEGSLGVIAEGALADMVMLDIEKPHWYPHNDPIAALVYSAKAGDVERVFVDGAELVSGGRVAGLNLTEAMHDAAKIIARINSGLS
jgi:5-methylthioadenosine/S-adenosylhomocysteine deaminase